MQIESIDTEIHGGGETIVPTGDFMEFEGNAYQCRALLVPEPDGGYSVHALRLPGVVSEGESEAEALANIAEAFAAAISSYLDAGESVPWEDVVVDDAVHGIERWIIVDV